MHNGDDHETYKTPTQGQTERVRESERELCEVGLLKGNVEDDFPDRREDVQGVGGVGGTCVVDVDLLVADLVLNEELVLDELEGLIVVLATRVLGEAHGEGDLQWEMKVRMSVRIA